MKHIKTFKLTTEDVFKLQTPKFTVNDTVICIDTEGTSLLQNQIYIISAVENNIGHKMIYYGVNTEQYAKWAERRFQLVTPEEIAAIKFNL